MNYYYIKRKTGLTSYLDQFSSLLIMATQSWYVSNQCISLDGLQPIWFIILANALQYIITCVQIFGPDAEQTTSDNEGGKIQMATSKASSIDTDTEQSKPSAMDAIKNKLRCILKPFKRCKPLSKPLQIGLKIWSVISMIVIMIFDINDIIIWMKNNTHRSGWDHFMCMGGILFTSSNFKKFMPFLFAGWGIKLKYDEDNNDQNCFSFKLCTKNMTNLTSISLLFTMITYLIMICPWFYVIGCSGLFVAAWPVLVFYFTVMMIPLYLDWLPEHDDPKLWKRIFFWCWALLFLATLYGLLNLFSSFALVTVNVYSGMNYWDSFYFVFEERKTAEYFSYALSNVKSKFRLITWIF